MFFLKQNHLPGLVVCALMCAGASASGVIVAGASGGADNTNNTTRAQLEAELGVADGSFFDNVFRVGGGNAVYIGFKNTQNGPVGYALSGMHLGNPATLSIQSVTYQVDAQFSIDGSDLALIRFTNASNIMPSLKAISLSPTALSNNTPLIMIGEGRNRSQNATIDANTSDAVAVTDGTGYTTTGTRLKRWGTNVSSNFSAPPSPTRTFGINGRDTVTGRTVFDQPGNGTWLATNEAQAVTNDSGGGVFSYDGSLVGIMVAVDATDATQAAFGNTTLFADIATYKTLVDAETGGALVPEPASLVLVLAGLGWVLALRRRPGSQVLHVGCSPCSNSQPITPNP